MSIGEWLFEVFLYSLGIALVISPVIVLMLIEMLTGIFNLEKWLLKTLGEWIYVVYIVGGILFRKYRLRNKIDT